MATRATVAIQMSTGEIAQIYVHFDGYPDGLGKELYDNYRDPEKILELINHGDASSVESTIDACEFYSRDRGEDECEAFQFQDLNDYFDRARNEEFNYLFSNKGYWLVSRSNLTEMESLERVLEGLEALED